MTTSPLPLRYQPGYRNPVKTSFERILEEV